MWSRGNTSKLETATRKFAFSESHSTAQVLRVELRWQIDPAGTAAPGTLAGGPHGALRSLVNASFLSGTTFRAFDAVSMRFQHRNGEGYHKVIPQV